MLLEESRSDAELISHSAITSPVGQVSQACQIYRILSTTASIDSQQTQSPQLRMHIHFAGVCQDLQIELVLLQLQYLT